ncbi:MAG: beta-L-arabinofuranosidase domain-containing protein [Bacteroidota bacterium]
MHRIILGLLCLVGLLNAQDIPQFELDHRIQLSVDRLTDQDRQPAFSHDFLLADVKLNPADPRRFYNFSGDLSGRYIEVMSLLSEERRETIKLDELVKAVISFQKADGRFGDPDLQYNAKEIGGEHMALLWGNGRLLVGLMAYYEQTKDPATLVAATKLGDFFITTAQACREPAVVELLKTYGAKGIICFTQYIEGLAMLAKAADEERFVQAAKDAYTVMPPRGTQHSHGYLSTLRGVLLLYELTQDPNMLDYVESTFTDLLDSEDHTVYGAVFEFFGGETDATDAGSSGNRDEGCSSADFVRLSLHLHQLTGDEKYLEAGEKGLLNALYYNQYGNGDFGHHYFSDGVIKASNPRRSWWCCTMHGLRGLLAVKNEFGITREDDQVQINLLTTQTYDDGQVAFSIEQEELEAGREQFRIRIDNWERGIGMILPKPDWGKDWKTHLNGKEVTVNSREKNTTLSYSGLKPGDLLELSAKFALSFHAPGKRETEKDLPNQPTNGYLTYGPYVLGINQESFVAEPDWANQVLLPDLVPAAAPNTLTTSFRHSGYPGIHPVKLVPMAYQLYQGHPYLRLTTNYGKQIIPKSPDE